MLSTHVQIHQKYLVPRLFLTIWRIKRIRLSLSFKWSSLVDRVFVVTTWAMGATPCLNIRSISLKKTGNVPSVHLTGWLSVSNTLMGVKKSLSTLKLACLSSDTEFQQDFAFKRANYLNKGVSVCRILHTLH